MALSQEEVFHIARLARLGLGQGEVEKLHEQLSRIIDYFQALQEVNTTEVPPTAYPIPLQNIFREDQITPSLSPEQVLANAPQAEEGHFKVRAVLELEENGNPPPQP
ncbi:MAG: Asp-tRNA(Asn)/Glu-tRNA(Gln) amidotransferase subunit GatC [Chloroflexota bacterium]